MRFQGAQLSLRLVRRGDVVVLFVNGALDARSAAGLTRTLDEIWSQPFASLWVDLAGTDRLDEAGLDVLLRARERAVASDREFLIRSPSTEAVRALERSAAWPLLGGG